jgi:hypothetical protein
MAAKLVNKPGCDADASRIKQVNTQLISPFVAGTALAKAMI